MRMLGYFIIVILSMSCGEDELNPEMQYASCLDNASEAKQSDLNYSYFFNNKTKWNCREVKHYSITQRYAGGICSGIEARVEVMNGEIINISPIEADRDITGCPSLTIEHIFFKIEEAVDSSIVIIDNRLNDRLLPDDISVEYESIYGIPIKGKIDYSKGTIDDEFIFEVYNLKIIEE